MSEIRVPAWVVAEMGEVVKRILAKGSVQGLGVEGLTVVVREGRAELVDRSGSFGGKSWEVGE